MLLLIVTVLLSIMSSFIWSAFSSNILAYQSMGASKWTSEQLLIAEQALNEAEFWLKTNDQLPIPTPFCAQRPCVLPEYSPDYMAKQEANWWKSPNNWAVNPIIVDTDFAYSAFYAVEALEKPAFSRATYYRITGWAQIIIGEHENPPIILQSIWSKANENGYQYRSAWRRW